MTATWTLEFPYRRSVGPVIGEFLGGLRDGRVLGATTAGGKVLVPPLEYDPDTGEPTGELVAVGEAGVVEHVAWIAEPLRHHPLDRPFAWALVRLDGADTSLLHARRLRAHRMRRPSAHGCASAGRTNARARSPTSPASSPSDERSRE